VVLAAVAAVVIAGGAATAAVVDDGLGVNDPAEEKIPYVVERINSIEDQIESLSASKSAEDVAYRQGLENELAAAEKVLGQLCAESQSEVPDCP
jgi:hypothetical protein